MSFVMDWVYGFLGWLGLFKKDAKLVFMGLDNAGKTTLMHMLTHDKLSVMTPTLHAGVEKFQIGNCEVTAVDLGGHEGVRALWSKYAYGINAVVYIVDCADQDRFPESKKELDALLKMEQLQNVPFLILGNKIDLPNAVPEHILRGALGLSATTGKTNFNVGKDTGIRPIELFCCSIVWKKGYQEAFEWLMKFV